MGFEISTMLYDPTRKVNRTNLRSTIVDGTYYKTYAEVPYNISFSLYVFTRHMDDMLQIVEQIMPFFVPDHVITIDLNENQSSVNVPIVMISNNITDRYEGDFNTRRLHIASFSFLAKSYIYGNLKNVTTISSSDNNTIEFD